MSKNSTVRNLITDETFTYYNGCDLETNLISAIVYQENPNKLLHYKFREEISEIAKIERIPSLDGSEKVYSSTYDMIAYHGITD